MRVLVAGDVHARAPWWWRVCAAAAGNGCSTLLQLGDFGWWPHVGAGAAFLAAANEALDTHGLHAAFVDGNHENFHDLWTHPAGPDGSVTLGPRLRYLPRGYYWTWDDTRFAALGGAHSTDVASRVPGLSWWPQERIRSEDVAGFKAPANVLVCHDAPSGIEQWRGRSGASGDSAAHRRIVREVVDRVRPKLVLHGHYHHRYSGRLRLDDGSDVAVEGLGRDGDAQGSCLLLDAATLRVRPVSV